MACILIAEDEPGIASFLEKGLRAEGHDVMIVADGRAAADQARDDAVDLLVLDLGLPGLDGLDVLREIRARGERLPVVVLTARDDLASRVESLDLGADDHIGKPFEVRELLARVRARLRMREVGAPLVRGGGVTLDLTTRLVRVGDQVVELTSREAALAETLMRSGGRVMSRDELVAEVWGDDAHASSNVVDVYVLYLRRKLGDGFVRTVRGKGYALGAAVDARAG